MHHIYAWPVLLIYCFVFKYILGNFQSSYTANVMLYLDLPASSRADLHCVRAWRRIRILESATTLRMTNRILPYLGVFAIHTIVGLVIHVAQMGTEFGKMTPDALDQFSLVLKTLALFAGLCRDAGVFPTPLTSKEETSNSSIPSRTTITQIEGGGATSTSTSGGSPTVLQGEKINASNKLRLDVMRYMSAGIQITIEVTQQGGNNATGRRISADFTGTGYGSLRGGC
ncbi:hypothetical protein ON010_g16702 [Phytophthora cinnamomi]|nr:hypothetical protein ON010_g16702 [Phytophthora cinnamomi]